MVQAIYIEFGWMEYSYRLNRLRQQRPLFPDPQRPLFLLLALLLGLLIAWLPWWFTLAAVGGTAVLLLVLSFPVLGVSLSLLAGPFGALENVILGNSLLDSGQLLLLFSIGAWIAKSAVRKRFYLHNTSITIPIAFFATIGLLSLNQAPSITFGLREVVKWVEIWLIIQLLLSEYRTWPHSPRAFILLLLGSLLATGLLQAVIGIWQFGLRGTGPEHFAILGNYYRAYGTFEQPNPFGGFMHLTALVAIGVVGGFLPLLWAQRYRLRVQFTQLTTAVYSSRFLAMWVGVGLVAVVAVLATMALLFSWSRGAWLSWAAGTAVIGLFLPRQRWVGVAILVLGGGLFFTAVQANWLHASINQRLVGFVDDFRLEDVRGADINNDNYAVLERLAHWQAAVSMAEESIWLGVGFGNYEPAYPEHALINWPDPLGHAHNYYLNLLAEVGIIGLASYLIMWLIIVRQTAVLIGQNSPLIRGIALGLMGAWIALSVHHLVDKLYVNNIYIHLGVMIGLLQIMHLTIATSLSES